MKPTAEREHTRPRILYAASTQSHLVRFHMPYIEALRGTCEVRLMAAGGDVEIPVAFEKRMFSPANLRAVRQIRRVLRQERFDAVILNTSLAAFLVRAAMLGMRKRPWVLNIVHGYLFGLHPRGLRERVLLLCEKLTRRQTDRIAVMNREDLDIANRYRLCRGEVVFLRGMGFRMPPGDPGALHAEAGKLRAQLAPAPQERLLAFVGELSRRKNQIFLIRALARLRGEGLPVRLLLVGEGSERAALEAEIAALGLSSAVCLAGNREPVFPYLAAADLYVSASLTEGLPFNLMEAMACGLPVIASDVKGQRDLLRDAPGRLYPPGDTEAFCRAVRRALAEPAMGCGAVDYPWLEAYRLEAVFDENLQIMKGWTE